jgi:prephenate dehydrogenase
MTSRSHYTASPYRISLLGVGLINGSLGLAFKSSQDSVEITGYASRKTLRRALRRGAIDFAAYDLESAVADADCVVLGMPIEGIRTTLKTIGPYLKRGAIVTDVGSVKRIIVQDARRYLPSHVTFIGGHPMAGSEKQGIGAADPLLFQNAVYVLCPVRGKALTRNSRFIRLLESTGARLLYLDPTTHDRIAAAVSHVPQLLAVAMMNIVGAVDSNHHPALQLAAGGFRDITRIASSPYEIWDDILRYNKAEIRQILRLLIRLISAYPARISSGTTGLKKEFHRAKELRDAIPKNTKGFLAPLYDIFVQIKDEPGSLQKLTGILAKNSINIKDIELLKIREGTGGTFRLSFDSASGAALAVKVLQKRGFNAVQK